jgi:inorganic phosphate transporter, PiT family
METWLLTTSFLIAFAMAWAIGAQDVSNALGTSVGSKAITVQQAIYIAGIFEFAGSLAGGEVAGMISGGILSVKNFMDLGDDGVTLYAQVMFSTMFGAFLWLAFATYFSLPVSTTHSLVGALIGVGFLSLGPQSINYSSLTAIITSWVTSPLLGGAFAYIIFSTLHTTILIQPNPRKAAIENVPYFIGFTFGTLIAFIVRVGPKSIRLSVEASLMIFAFTAIALSVFIKTVGIKQFSLFFHRLSITFKGLGGAVVEVTSDKYDINNSTSDNAKESENQSLLEGGKMSKSSSSNNVNEQKLNTRTRISSTVVKSENSGENTAAFLRNSGSGDEAEEEGNALDSREDGGRKSDLALAEAMFINLMVITACVVSFAHGSNDVSNAIGPFTAIQEIWFTGQISTDSKPPAWILVGGGVGIVFGLGTYGHKVMATVGENIAKLTYTRGFTAQISTALTVLMATQLGLSVSTTHCLIGAITGVALVEGSEKINKATIKKIIMSWLVTLPASAFFGVLIFWVFGFKSSTKILENNARLHNNSLLHSSSNVLDVASRRL